MKYLSIVFITLLLSSCTITVRGKCPCVSQCQETKMTAKCESGECPLERDEKKRKKSCCA